jgi:hypothetical protein
MALVKHPIQERRTDVPPSPLLIEVTSTTLDSKDARHVLRLEEGPAQLTDRLMTEYHRAQFLRRPAPPGKTWMSDRELSCVLNQRRDYNIWQGDRPVRRAGRHSGTLGASLVLLGRHPRGVTLDSRWSRERA